MSSKLKCWHVLQPIRDRGMDILAIQETKVSPLERLNIARIAYLRIITPFYTCILERGPGDALQCLTGISWSLSLGSVFESRERIFLVVDSCIGTRSVRIIDVYAPDASPERKSVFLELECYLREMLSCLVSSTVW